MKRLLKKETGSTLVIVIMLLFFMSIIGFSLLTLNTNSMKLSKNEQIDQAVYYVAEAGINYYIDQINLIINTAEIDAFHRTQTMYKDLLDAATTQEKADEIMDTFDFQATLLKETIANLDDPASDFKKLTLNAQPFPTSVNPDTFKNSASTAAVVIKKKPQEPFITLSSTGTIGNKSRKISQHLKISVTSVTGVPTKVIVENNNGSGSGSYDDTTKPDYLIDDPEYKDKTPIYVNTHNINGKFSAGIGTISGFKPEKLIEKSDFDSKFIIPADVATVTATNNMVINQSVKINHIANIMNPPNSVNIDASKGPITIYLENFNPRIPFHVTGSHPVTFVVKGGMNMDAGFQLTKDNANTEVNILVDSHVNFNVGNGNDTLIQANIIALNSPFNLNTNKLKIDGNLITYTTNDMAINGSAHTYVNGLCAPYAKLNVNGKYTINGGSLVVNNLNYNGGAALDFTLPAKNSCALPSIFNDEETETEIEIETYPTPPPETPENLYTLEPLVEE